MAIQAVPQSYVIADLGALPGGANSVARGINANGWVVGVADTATGEFHAFLAQGGPLRDLGTLGGTVSLATGIDATGQVIGQAETAAGGLHAFLFREGTLHDLGTLGGRSSFASAINSAGQVVGKSGSAGGSTHAFVYDGGMVNLNSRLPSGSGWELVEATGINDAGQIVGYGRHEDRLRAFLLTPTAM
jgi:probable HAF family extracellular repeat protein